MVTFSEIHKRTPYGSATGTVLCLFGLTSDVYFSVRIANTNKYFENYVMCKFSDDSFKIEGDVCILEVFLAVLTVVLAFLVLLSGIAGSNERDTPLKRIFGTQIAYFTLLVSVFVLLFGWIFLNLCRTVLLGVYISYVSNCNANKNTNGCVVITFEWGTSEKIFCGSDLQRLCDNYVDVIYILYFFSVLSNQFVLVALIVYVFCLGINYKISQLQERIHCSEIDNRRY